MSAGRHDEIEQGVRRLCDAGNYDAAASLAIRGYGPELMGFLRAFHQSDDDASDAFSIFAEDLWKSLRSFAWECSLRTWSYALARRVSYRARQKARRMGARAARDGDSALSKIVAKVRTETLTYLRTEKKTRLRALRDTLPEADQMLLILRVDKDLGWDELARVMSEADADAESLKRESARLRKRFQLVKEKLVALAKKEGIYPPTRRDGHTTK